MWAAVALVFAVQLAIVFWLGHLPPVTPPRPPSATIAYLGDARSELLTLQDPTLFMLPHTNNFSGAAWLNIPRQSFAPTDWNEPERPLNLAAEKLGASFTAFMETNPSPQFQPDLGSEGRLIEQGVSAMRSIPAASRLRVQGELAKRRLLTPVQLPPQTNSDVLRNTEIQLLVDALGNPFSPVVVSSSGSKDVDDLALTNFAKQMRFEPIKAAAPGTVLPDIMTFGKLLFEWQTMPLAPTNIPPASL
jgi:hypothetical protein